jgi:hypothetical protein
MKGFLLLLLVFAQLCAQSASKPSKQIRITNHISMGISENGFLALLSGTLNVREKTDVDITDICRYEHNRQLLKNAVSYNAATRQYFACPAVTKVYVVDDPSPLWPRRQQIEFLFYRAYNSAEPFALFAIHTVNKLEVGSMNTLFDARLEAAIANRRSEVPQLLNTTYYLKNGQSIPARMAIWKMPTSRDMLYVPDNGTLIFTEFFYLDDAGFSAWQAATAAYKEVVKVKK